MESTQGNPSWWMAEPAQSTDCKAKCWSPKSWCAKKGSMEDISHLFNGGTDAAEATEKTGSSKGCSPLSHPVHVTGSILQVPKTWEEVASISPFLPPLPPFLPLSLHSSLSPFLFLSFSFCCCDFHFSFHDTFSGNFPLLHIIIFHSLSHAHIILSTYCLQYWAIGFLYISCFHFFPPHPLSLQYWLFWKALFYFVKFFLSLSNFVPKCFIIEKLCFIFLTFCSFF